MLYFDSFFRTEKYLAAFNWGTKLNAFFSNFSKLAKTEYLKATGIGQNGFVPTHKVMESAVRLYGFGARPEHQMKGIAQQNLGPGFRHLFR